ncbi:MAG: hypothetical protein R3B09_26630 [Nannocystaceae bacterium]
MTNTLGGAYEPVPSNDGSRVAYLSTSAYGYDLWVMALDPAEFFEPMPVTPPMPDIDDPTPALAEAEGRELTRHGPKSRRYRPLRYARLIAPVGASYSGASGVQMIGVHASVGDVIGFHRLGGRYVHYLDYNLPAGSVEYTYSQLLPSFTLGFERGFNRPTPNTPRFDYDHPEGGAYRLITDYREIATRGSLAMEVPVVRHPIHRASARLTYSYTRYTDLDAADRPLDPNAPASRPVVGDMGQLELYVEYANARGARTDVRQAYGDETGRRLFFALRLIDSHLGGRFGDLQLVGAYAEYLRMPWRGHQVLALRLGGGISAGGLGNRAPFRLGGFVPQPDLVTTLIQYSDKVQYECCALQGYAPGAFSGLYFSILNASYRIPLADVERGIGAVPLFLRKLTLSPLASVGAAWADRFTREAIKVGAGASLIFTFKIGYVEAVNLFLTYAHGFDKEAGLDTFVSAFGSSF